MTTCRSYLQLPEDLRLAAGLQVPQSLGPEAVLLVQAAVATRGADESTTTQEPKRESSMAVSRAAAACAKQESGKCSGFLSLSLCVCVSERRPEKSPILREIPRLKSPLDWIIFFKVFLFYFFQFHKSHPKNKKGRSGGKKSRELKAWDTKVQVGRKKKKSETDKMYPWGALGALTENVFFLALDRG